MAAVSLQEQLEAGIYNLLEDVNWDHTVTLRRWRDGTESVTYPAIIVQAGIVNYGVIIDYLWDVFVSIHVLTYDEDDEDQGVLNDLHDQAFRRALGLTHAQLQSEVSDIKVHGVFLDGVDAGIEDHEQRHTTNVLCKVEAELNGVTTTT